jgi:hypothetical protein
MRKKPVIERKEVDETDVGVACPSAVVRSAGSLVAFKLLAI